MTEKEDAPRQDASSNVTAAEDNTQPPQKPAGDDHGPIIKWAQNRLRGIDWVDRPGRERAS